MTRAAQIRKWLTDNPGWHFAADVAAALPDEDRFSVTQSLWIMSCHGHVITQGKRGSMRYSLGRPARKYERKAAA